MLLYSTSMYDHFCYCLLGQVGSWGPWGVTAVPLKHRSAGTEFSVLPGGLCSREKFYLGFFPLLFFFPSLCFGLLWGEFYSACPQGPPHQGGWDGPAPDQVSPFQKQGLDKGRKALSLRCSIQLLPLSSAISSILLIYTIPVRAPAAGEISAGGRRQTPSFPWSFKPRSRLHLLWGKDYPTFPGLFAP